MSESPEHGVPTRLARPMAEIREGLKDVIDPELGGNIMDLGLVYGLRFSERGVLEIDMTLTTAECPLTDVIEEQVASVLRNLVGTYHLNWVWLPPWSAQRITDEGREQLRALGFNI